MKWLGIFVAIAMAIKTISTQTPLSVSITGSFQNCDEVDECFFRNNNTLVQWGTPTIGTNRSGLEFVNVGNMTISVDQRTQIGSLLHHNWPIKGDIPDTVELKMNVIVSISSQSTNLTTSSNFTFVLNIDETNNRATPLNSSECPYANDLGWFGLYNESMVCCPYYTPLEACSDKIGFLNPIDVNKTFSINETKYTLKIEGFINYPAYEIAEDFITQEKEITEGIVYAEVVAACVSNATCDDGNECTFDECVDGFCDHNTSVYEGKTCNPQPQPHSFDDTYRIVRPTFELDENCHEHICVQGQCVEVDKNCSDSSSSSSSSSSSNNGSSTGDDDDEDDLLVPLLSSLASAIALLYCLLPCLFLPFLLCPLLLFLLKDAIIPATVAIRNPSPTELGPITTNPTYNPLETVGDNPLYE